MTARPTNWAGNVTFRAHDLHRPSSLEQLQRLVAGSKRVRALGTGHSFSRIADSSGDLVSVADMPRSIHVDKQKATVTAGAGVRYGELAGLLHAQGFALRNLASLPHISIAGACATGTHGSGNGQGNLATSVSALEMVTADGDVAVLSREADGDHFRGAVVGLGALGIVTRVSLDIVPAFDVRQYVYENLPREQLDDGFTEIFASGYSVSAFTDWRGRDINQVWLKRRVDESDPWIPEARWRGAMAASGPRHPILGAAAVHCTEQLGVPGPWHERLPHFRMEFAPSSGDELQSEYLLPRQYAIDAMAAIDAIGNRLAPVMQVSEIRTVASDDLWMSPSYEQESVAIHFTWIKDTPAVTPVVSVVEEQLAPFRARPHWGKLFGTSPDLLVDLYARLADFEQLIGRYDPAGKFRNEMIDWWFPTS